MDLKPENIVFVMVRPRNSQNIGSAARAINNMGFGQLRLAEPWHVDFEEAQRLAVDGAHLISPKMVYPTLAEALADVQVVYGTVARQRTGWSRYDIRQAAELIKAQHQENRIAILFGSERGGLSTDEVDHCDALLMIPTGGHVSLNLAQAVLLVAYELYNASQPAGSLQPPAYAPRQELEGLFDHALNTLEQVGFMGAERRHDTGRLLRQIVARNGLTSREVHLLRGMLRQVNRLTDQEKNRADDASL